MPPGTAAERPDDDEDLAPILRHVGEGKLAATRAKLANSPETRELLEIGLAILRADLVEHAGPDFEQGIHSHLFEKVSRNRILELAAERDQQRDRELRIGDGAYRSRWNHKNPYTEDLIAYLFRPGPTLRHFEEMAQAGREMMKEASLGELVRALAGAEVEVVTSDPLSMLQAIVQSAMPNHPRVREFSRATYDHLLPRWARLYEEVTSAYGLTLSSRCTWLDVALLFNSVVESAVVRKRAEGAEPVLSSGDGVLAGAILAWLPTLLANCPADLDACYPVMGP